MLRTAFALALLLNCNPEMPPDPPDLDPELTLGTGEGAFSSFEDGETLDLVAGCQGYQHVWTAMRAQGIDPRGTLVDVGLFRASDGEMVSQVLRVRISMQPVPGNDGVYELYGLTVIVPEPDTAIGEELIFRASVTDRDEVVVMDERPVRIAWGEGGCRGG